MTGLSPALAFAEAEVVFVDRLPDRLEGGVSIGLHMEARRGDLLVRLPGIARYRVSGACRIEIEPEPGVPPEVAGHYASVTPFGAIVLQRGELPLHASAVAPSADGPALLIAGVSGSGKSTLAAAFAQLGWQVLNDDVSRITALEGAVRVWPGSNTLKLGDRSCDLLAVRQEQLGLLPGQPEKSAWRQPGAEGRPREIAAIVELSAEGEQSGAFRPLSGGETMQLLVRQTFRRLLVRPLGCQLSHFSMLDAVARQVPCYHLPDCQRTPPLALARRLAAEIL